VWRGEREEGMPNPHVATAATAARRQSRYAKRERLKKKNNKKTTNITNGLKFNIVPNTV